MILWCDGGHDPAENMRRDAALLAAASGSAAFEPVLRLFQFRPHGVTLGHAQRPDRVLHLEHCRRDGIPWAVRPTGGRAIFHAEEWTYSLTARIDDSEWGGSLTDAYHRASRLLLVALRRLGVPAELAPGRRDADREDAACFASTARHELTVQGRKLVGSAQRRTAQALLQQGSVLIGPGHERLADYRAIPKDRIDLERERLSEAAATAAPWLGADRTLQAFAMALEDALVGSGAFGVRRHDGDSGAFLLTLSETDSYTASVLDRST